jgi:hypothetical protein
MPPEANRIGAPKAPPHPARLRTRPVSRHPLPRGERGWRSLLCHSSPLPSWERAFRRDLAQRSLRKSHGGKGEGVRLEGQELN